MSDDVLIRDALNRLEPEVADRGNWGHVLADAGRGPDGRGARRVLSRRLILALALLAVLVIAIATPALGLQDTIRRWAAAPEKQTADQAAEMRRLAMSGPNDIRCSGFGAKLTCEGVAGPEVLDRLRGGQVLYGRHIYGDVTNAVDSGVPFLEADELLCDSPDGAGRMACSPAAEVPPTVEPGQRMLVTYRRYHVKFGESGNTIGRHGERVVPLTSHGD
jgi:hypothetical protein